MAQPVDSLSTLRLPGGLHRPAAAALSWRKDEAVSPPLLLAVNGIAQLVGSSILGFLMLVPIQP